MKHLLIVAALGIVLGPSPLRAQERIVGAGPWEFAWDVLMPDPNDAYGVISGGMVRARFATSAECTAKRNTYVAEAQFNIKNLSDNYGPRTGIIRSLQSKAAIGACRNVETGQSSLSPGVPGGTMTPIGGAGGQDEIGQALQKLLNTTTEEAQARGLGAAVANLLGGGQKDAAALSDLAATLAPIFSPRKATNNAPAFSLPDPRLPLRSPKFDERLNGHLEEYLKRQPHKAVAIAHEGAGPTPDGGYFEGRWAYGVSWADANEEDAVQGALEECRKATKGLPAPCQVFAINHDLQRDFRIPGPPAPKPQCMDYRGQHSGDWSGTFEAFYRERLGCTNGIWWGSWLSADGRRSYYYLSNRDSLVASTRLLIQLEAPRFLQPR
jgi:hypothetical protein